MHRKRNIRLNKPRRQLTKMSGKQAIADLESTEVNTENGITDGTVLSPNALRRKNRGKSEIETLARTIDDRRKNRMTVTFWERKKFLDICLQISKMEGKSFSRFSKQGLVRLVEDLRERVANQPKASRFYDKLLHLIGYWEADKSMLRLFEAGLEYTENSDEDEFYFRDFNFYCTVIASTFSFMRVPGFFVLFWLILFYFGSAVLFCAIMENDHVCPKMDGYGVDGGWMTSIYFASATLSTVGYGDVSLYEEGNNWTSFVAIIYMLFAMAIAFTVFTSAAKMALDGIFKFNVFSSLKTKIMGSKDITLYKQVRRLIALRVVELTIYFLALNATGIFVARIFVHYSDVEGEQWSWMTTIYWAIQTTTTIGYGDLDMPFHLRWFNIFFTTFGTAFVGIIFGSLAGLQEECADHRRYHAWKRRELSKMMVDELQLNDDKLDQYEFVVGSLLLLRKVKTDDINQIMEKFRELACDKNYISVSNEIDGKSMALMESKNGGVPMEKCDSIDFDKILR